MQENNTIYTAEHCARMHKAIIKTSTVLEAIADLFGDNPQEWRIRRADAETVTNVTQMIRDLMDYYTDGLEDLNADVQNEV